MAGDPVTLPAIDLTRVIRAIEAAPLDDQAEVAEYLERAVAADSEGERIDLLRVEGVLPKVAGKKGEPARVVVAVSADLRRGALDALASGVGSQSADVGRPAGRGGSASVPRPARARSRRVARTPRSGRPHAIAISGS